MRRRPFACAGALCLALSVAACGTTVQQTGATTADSGFGSATGTGPAAGLSPPGGVASGGGPATSGAAVAGSATGSQPSASIPGASGTVGSTGSAVPIPKSGPVLIGFATEKDITSVASALGISGVNGGDIEAQLKAVVGNINAHGGLAGHKIVVLEHEFNRQDRISNPAGAAQAACADWTQDHHVFAVVDTYVVIASLPGMIDCLGKAGVPLISDWPTDDANDAEYASHPLVASPSSMTVDSYIPTEVDRLYANGFFTGWNGFSMECGAE